MTKWKIKQDYRTLGYEIKAGTIGEEKEDNDIAVKSVAFQIEEGGFYHFSYEREVLNNTDWFEKVEERMYTEEEMTQAKKLAFQAGRSHTQMHFLYKDADEYLKKQKEL